MSQRVTGKTIWPTLFPNFILKGEKKKPTRQDVTGLLLMLMDPER